jgi:hypothetical protein
VQISIVVPYDEARLRRTLEFILRPQVTVCRILGAVLIPLGVAMALLRPLDPPAYVSVLLGLWLVFGVGPTAIRRSVLGQSNAIRADCHVTLDHEWITATYPLVESRYRWAAIDRVVDSDETWYVMFGKRQALTIPKDPMTADEQAEFGAFVAGLASTATQRTGAANDRRHEQGPASGPARVPSERTVRSPAPPPSDRTPDH